MNNYSDARLTPRDIQVRVHERQRTISVRFNGDAFGLALCSFRAAFPMARYIGGAWLLPSAERPRLRAWLLSLCEPGAWSWESSRPPPAVPPG